MSFFVVIRGPLGIGKTTVARALARQIGGEYVSIDQILEDHHLEEWEDGYISERSFLRANRVAIAEAEPALRRGKPVVFDGNFYWRPVIEDLLAHLAFPAEVFTLQAPLEVCLARDGSRPTPFGPEAVRDVYRQSTAFDWGVPIDATPPLADILRRIHERLPPPSRPD